MYIRRLILGSWLMPEADKPQELQEKPAGWDPGELMFPLKSKDREKWISQL